MDIKTMQDRTEVNENKQAMEKRKENAKAIIADRQRNNRPFGINGSADGAFGIRKPAKIIKDNALNVKDTAGTIKTDIRAFAKNTGKEIKDIAKDAKKMAFSDAKAMADYGKSGAIRARMKKTMREAAPPKVRLKNVIRKAKIKEMMQSSGDMRQMTENVYKAGVNTITSTLQYIARCIMKGCMLVAKKLIILMGPVVGIFFLFAFLILYICGNGNRSGFRLNVPETGKVDGVRVDMQGIETNPWYTTKNPFHQSGYGMVPRKSSGKGNCTCYAWGRRAEITGKAPNLSTGNASAWYDYNRRNKIYQYGSVPKPGAVCCWRGGSDGSGHVAIVETVNKDGSFTISESSWTRFFFRTRSGKTADHMDEGNLIFQGFIYLDAYE